MMKRGKNYTNLSSHFRRVRAFKARISDKFHYCEPKLEFGKRNGTVAVADQQCELPTNWSSTSFECNHSTLPQENTETMTNEDMHMQCELFTDTSTESQINSEVSTDADSNIQFGLPTDTAIDESLWFQLEQTIVNNDDDSDFEGNEELENLLNILNTAVSLRDKLRKWAVEYQIKCNAIDALLLILRDLDDKLPKHSRTLLKTPRKIEIIPTTNGEYWHNGLTTCLQKFLFNFEKDEDILLSFNMDGLPLHKSSKKEFWPILVSVENLPQIRPKVVGIFYGTKKPNTNEYLSMFVDELNELLETGLVVNDKQFTFEVRCFICDLPARALIKCTRYFNHTHGCAKCDTEGEFMNRVMTFLRIGTLRTNNSFRLRLDEDHHNGDSILENITGLNMVNAFPVAEDLHLRDLGLMKTLLLRWVSAPREMFKDCKFTANDIQLVSTFMENSNVYLPKEFHRKARSLDVLRYFKGVEFRQFFYYLGPVILKDVLPKEYYNHFIMLFCAFMICSCKRYEMFLDIADKIFHEFVELCSHLYGLSSVSMNFHSLYHVVEDVRKLGPLPTFSGYKYESLLFFIKSLLRTGNLPLSQVALRILEIQKIDYENYLKPKTYPGVIEKKKISETHQLPNCKDNYREIYIADGLLLNSEPANKWFFTKKGEIVSMINATYCDGVLHIFGRTIKKLSNFFEKPFLSQFINVFQSDGTLTEPKLFKTTDVKFKMVGIYHKNNYIFIPMVHTLDMYQEDEIA